MSQSEQPMVCATAIIALIYLIGPSAVRRIIATMGEWLAVILVLICVL